MLRAIKYRIYPNEDQRVRLAKTFGCCRWAYNYFLQLRNTMYDEEHKSISCYEMMSKLPELKKEYPWLTEVCANALQQALRHLDNAFTNFFRHTADYPKFKKKQSAQSFTEPGGISIVGSRLLIPKFREGIKVVQHRSFSGKIKSATVSVTASNKYYVSLVIDDEQDIKQKDVFSQETTIGIDLGIKDFAIFSTGERVENPKYLSTYLPILAREQRKLSRMQKGSKNREKQRIKVIRIYEHIANQRNDFLHNLTYRLTHESQVSTICIEDLDVKELLEKKTLSRNIADVSWSRFRALLTYKCEWYGKNLVVIPRYAPSSKLCTVCGSINENLTLADRTWICPTCQTVHDRDLNAAQKIRKIGLEQMYRRPS